MSKFCDLVLHVHPTIQYINVGIGGQTPKNIYPLCVIDETLKQGIMYMDSKQQYQIGARIKPEVKTTLQTRLERFSEPFKQAILYLSPYFENIETIPDALVSINSEVTDTLPWFLQRINLPPQLSIEDFRHITFDNYQRMIEQEKARISTVCKIFNSPTERELSQWLPTIPNEELNFISIIKNDYSPELQITLLRRLPPEEQLKALHELDLDNHSLFEKYLKKPEYLKTILEFYTPEELYMALITHLTHGFVSKPYFLTPASRSDSRE